jgi:hypothetical protein
MRNKAERKLAKMRFDYEENLAERKFDYEKKLAERKFELENKRYVREKTRQLAEESLTLAYHLRATISRMRTPIPGFVEVYDEGDEAARAVLIKQTYQAILDEYELEKEIIDKFLDLEFRMKSWFDGAGDDVFAKFKETIIEISAGARILLKHPRFFGKTSSILKLSPEGDLIDRKIDDAIQLLENVCRPILSEQPDV